MYYVSVFGGLTHHGGVGMVIGVTHNCGNGFFSDIWVGQEAERDVLFI